MGMNGPCHSWMEALLIDVCENVPGCLQRASFSDMKNSRKIQQPVSRLEAQQPQTHHLPMDTNPINSLATPVDS